MTTVADAEINKRANLIRQRLIGAINICIILSKPLDHDCLGSACALRWWFGKMKKKNITRKNSKIRIISFHPINHRTQIFPSHELVEFVSIEKFEFEKTHLMVLVDGGDWRQFFTSDWEKYIFELQEVQMVHIDHHQEGPVHHTIGDYSICYLECCTAKIVHDYFIKYDKLKLDNTIAKWLYLALRSDTGDFKHQLYKDTFTFASVLFKYDVHSQGTDDNMVSPKYNFDYFQWAIKNTDYYPKANMTVLILNDEKTKQVQQLCGEDCDIDELNVYYKANYMRLVDNYPYGVILSEQGDNVKIGWRTRTGAPIDIQKILENIGFEAGGHRNAGGGVMIKVNLSTVLKLLVDAMEKAVQTSIATP